ncbi:hypothetical protein ACFOY2_35095 [Nonomuraea purpurea]|uniref:Uncharacterized protein n=1 Tax=Nonomuraea purpurea TaxID=1849276 RepID=A0ABV8GJI9_9ACTN
MDPAGWIVSAIGISIAIGIAVSLEIGRRKGKNAGQGRPDDGGRDSGA